MGTVRFNCPEVLAHIITSYTSNAVALGTIRNRCFIDAVCITSCDNYTKYLDLEDINYDDTEICFCKFEGLDTLYNVITLFINGKICLAIRCTKISLYSTLLLILKSIKFIEVNNTVRVVYNEGDYPKSTVGGVTYINNTECKFYKPYNDVQSKDCITLIEKSNRDCSKRFNCHDILFMSDEQLNNYLIEELFLIKRNIFSNYFTVYMTKNVDGTLADILLFDKRNDDLKFNKDGTTSLF